ncbi:MAG: hypothetical protein A2Z20_01365 [Bdellovibrionales bacterium RBG_16_40_8]|nr:MAG: hypothetical protein A2Z20_01365 [Bdellovibrionales bacterium RBG_16_40_8]
MRKIYFWFFLSSFFYSLFWAVGCATLSDEVSIEKINSKQRLYVGRVLVNFNGETNPKCEIYLSYDIAPSIKLSSDGFVVYKTDRQELKFKELTCYHKVTSYIGAWHHQKLALRAIKRPQDSSEVNYFGDIHIDWVFDPKTSKIAADKDYDTRAPYKTGQIKDSGDIKIWVGKDMAYIENAFYSKVSGAREKGFRLQSALTELFEL